MNELEIYKQKLVEYLEELYSFDSNQSYRAGFNDAVFHINDVIKMDKI